MEFWHPAERIAASDCPDARLSGIATALWCVRRRGGLWVRAGEGEAIKAVHPWDSCVGSLRRWLRHKEIVLHLGSFRMDRRIPWDVYP